jgi:hypothetical protein
VSVYERTDIDYERADKIVHHECGVGTAVERQGGGTQLLGVSERHTWRILAAYREEGAAVLAHGNRDRLPPNATSATGAGTQVIALARERYQGVNRTHLTELLAEREGVVLSRSTVRRLLVGLGWDGDWYQDEGKKCIHGELVRAGMEWARLRGKAQGDRAGRVSPEIPGGSRAYWAGRALAAAGQPGEELAIGYATLKRLLDARIQPAEQHADGSSPPAAADYCGDANAYAEVLH